MRITGGRLIDLAAVSTNNHQTAVGKLADQVSSGMRVRQPSEDPAAWLAAHRAGLRRTLSEGTGVAMQFSRDRLDETDRLLSTIQDAVAQTRLLTVQGASETYNAANRAELGTQVRAMFEVALGAANSRAPDGEFMLAGVASLVAPFDAGGAYQGDATTRAVPIEDGATTVVTIAGADLTVARGVDVLPLLDRVATALATNDVATIQASLTDLDTAIKQLSMARSRTGGAMAVLEQTQLAHSQLEQNMTAEIARHVEIDTVGAASELAKASQALDASRTVSSHLIAVLARAST